VGDCYDGKRKKITIGRRREKESSQNSDFTALRFALFGKRSVERKNLFGYPLAPITLLRR